MNINEQIEQISTLHCNAMWVGWGAARFLQLRSSELCLAKWQRSASSGAERRFQARAKLSLWSLGHLSGCTLRYSNAGYTGASYTMYYLHPPTYFVDLIVHFESPKLDVSQIKMTFEEGAVCNSHQGTCDLQCPPLDFDDNSLDLHIPRLSNRCSFPFHSTSIGFSETRDKRPKRKIIWCHFIMPT